MINTRSTLLRVSISLSLLSCLTVSMAVATPNPQSLSKTERKALLASAKTPADHQKLAMYYREEARRLTAKSQDFAEQADFLATQPATVESKQGISCQCTSHYRYFSKLYAREAKDAEAAAFQQQQLVQGLSDNEATQK